MAFSGLAVVVLHLRGARDRAGRPDDLHAEGARQSRRLRGESRRRPPEDLRPEAAGDAAALLQTFTVHAVLRRRYSERR